MALKLNSSGGGSVTIDPVSTASNVTITIPATNAGSLVTADSSGNVTATGNIAAVGGTFSGDVQSASQNGGQLAGLRNKYINGNMGIFQRGTAAVTTNAAYGPADRWQTTSVGNTFSTTQGSFVSGDTLYDTGGAQYFTQIAVTSVAAAGNYTSFQQKIEDVRILAGQTVTVSFWAKGTGTGLTIGLEISQSFGTGGSPSAQVTGTGQSQLLTTSWAKYSKTFTVPSINGKTIGTDANSSLTQLIFWLDAGSNLNTRTGSIGQASKTVSIAQVQLEIGSVATPFEHRPIGMELAMCQRYYEKSFPQATTPASALGSGASGAHRFIAGKAGAASQFTNVKFSVTKRASTGVTVIYNPVAAGNQVRDPVAAADCTATATTTVENNFFLTCTGAATTAVGNYLDFAWTVESEL